MQQQVSELWLRVCESTNDEAARLAKSGVISGSFVVAEQQTAGRGRRGRTWSSPPGGLYMSIITRPVLPVGEQYRVALAAGVAVAEALMSQCSWAQPRLKWPNDVVAGSHKLGGILTEVVPGAVIVGVGINLSVHDTSLGLPFGSIALEDLIDKVPDRAGLARTIALSVNNWAQKCYSSEFLEVVRLWRTYMARDIDVTTDTPRGTFWGTQHDMREDGSLVVKDSDNNYHTITCGDVQIVVGQ